MGRRMTPDGEIKIETRAGGKRTLVGYAAVFHRAGDPGTEFRLNQRSVERITPTAFNRALEERQDVRALFNHSKDHLLGRLGAGTLRLAVDSRGLRYEVDLPDTTVGRDVLESVERGDLTGSSFGFIVPSGGDKWAPENGMQVRNVLDVNLIDVGPVVFPAYEGATAAIRDGSNVDEALASLAAHEKRLIDERFEEVKKTIDNTRL